MGLEEVAPFGVVERGVVFVDEHAVNDELSGWAGSNRRKPRAPKARALPTELHPETGRLEPCIRPDSVTVRAHELALRKLFEDKFRPPVPHLGADLPQLRRSREMVPVHRLRREEASAIGAGSSGLHLA